MDKVLCCAVQYAVQSESVSATTSQILFRETSRQILVRARMRCIRDYAAKTWADLVLIWTHINTIQCLDDVSNYGAVVVDAETKANAMLRDAIRDVTILDGEWLHIQYMAAVAARSAQASYELLENELRYDPCLQTNGGPALKADCAAM